MRTKSRRQENWTIGRWHSVGTHFELFMSRKPTTKPFLGPRLDLGECVSGGLGSLRWVEGAGGSLVLWGFGMFHAISGRGRLGLVWVGWHTFWHT